MAEILCKNCKHPKDKHLLVAEVRFSSSSKYICVMIMPNVNNLNDWDYSSTKYRQCICENFEVDNLSFIEYTYENQSK